MDNQKKIPPQQVPQQRPPVVPQPPTATTPIQPAPSVPGFKPPVMPSDPTEEKKVKLLEKLVAVSIVFDMMMGGFLLFIAAFVFAWRLDLVDYFRTGNPNGAQFAIANVPLPSPEVVEAEEEEEPPVYINEQGIDIEKAFLTAPDNIKLNIKSKPKKEVFGYLPYWAIPKLDALDIRVYTHIAYFGLEVDGDGNIVKNDVTGAGLTPWQAFQSDKKLDAFLKKAKREKVKVSITFKAFSKNNINKLALNKKAQDNFINNALFIMNSKNLDGINLDWEYIGTPEKKVIEGFSTMVANLKNEMKRQYPKSSLTIASFVDAATNTRIHDIAELSKVVDGIVIMGYDFYTPNSKRIGAIAPLEGKDYSISHFLEDYFKKSPANKLILAVPYYGYDWPVTKVEANTTVSGTRADVRVYPYGEIVESTKKTQINWDPVTQTPWYSYSDPKTKKARVVHFENTRSLGLKYDFVNTKGMQGVGVWAMGYDGRRTELLQLLADKFAN